MLYIEPPFRAITSRIILDNLASLIVTTNGQQLIDQDHLNVINKFYYSYVSSIKTVLQSNKYIKVNGFELFENEWKSYTSDISPVIEGLVSRPFLLIPFNLEDVIEGKDKNFLKIYRLSKNFKNSKNGS